MTEELVQLAAEVELQAADTQQPAKVSILAYNGGIVRLKQGPVVFDLDGLTIPDSVPLLADHQQDLDHMLGSGMGFIRDGKLFVEGTIARNAATADVLSLAQSGAKLQASVGVAAPAMNLQKIAMNDTVQVNGRTHTAPAPYLLVARKGVLREVTVCPLGADNQTVVTITAKQSRRDEELTIETETKNEQEAARIEAIESLCCQAGNPQMTVDGQAVSLLAHAIRNDWDRDRTELECLRAKAARVELEHVRNSREQGSFSRSECETPDEQLLQASLMARSGHTPLAVTQFGERTVERAAKAFGSMMDVARFVARQNGYDGGDRTEILRASFSGPSNLSLPVALGDTLHRVVEAIYRETPATWRSFAAVRSASDFRDQKSIRPSFVGELEELPEGGEIKHGVLQESSPLTWKIDTFAKVFAVDRKTIVNDDISFLEEMPPLLARAAMRKLSDLVWETLLGGTYSNEISGGSSPLSLASLQTAVTTMRTQRNAEGHDLDIMPKVLVVPPELETTARQILESVELQTIAGSDQTATETRTTANALKSIAKLEVEPRISNPRFAGASATQWFLFGGPIDLPAIVGFLDGQQTPRVEFFGMDHDANRLGVQWRCYHDFGAILGDTKASVHSLGA